MVAVLDLVNKTFYTCPIQRAHLRYALAGEIRSHALRAVKHFAKRGFGFILLSFIWSKWLLSTHAIGGIECYGWN